MDASDLNVLNQTRRHSIASRLIGFELNPFRPCFVRTCKIPPDMVAAAPLPRDRRTRSAPSWIDVGIGVFAVLMIWVAVHAVNDRNDFVAFYSAAKSWRLHGPVPNEGPLDLNPPTFSILLSPLTWLSLGRARLAWAVIGALALGDSLRRIRRRLHLDGRTVYRIIVACVALQPAVFAWALGQLTWVLLWLVTRAWLEADRPLRAGSWLGAAIAIKPPFALMAVLLPSAVLGSSAVIAATITGVACVITGIGPWLDWLKLNRDVSWLSLRPNASLWGIAARIESRHLSAVHLSDIGWYYMALIVLIGVALALLIVRTQGSRRWLYAGLWSATLSPLGWTYYWPVLLGPAAASRPLSRGPLTAAILMTTVPVPFLYWLLAPLPGGTAAAGSVYSGALAMLWITWRPGRRPGDLTASAQPATRS